MVGIRFHVQAVAACYGELQHQGVPWAVAAAVLPLLLHGPHPWQSALAAALVAAAMAAVPVHCKACMMISVSITWDNLEQRNVSLRARNGKDEKGL